MTGERGLRDDERHMVLRVLAARRRHTVRPLPLTARLRYSWAFTAPRDWRDVRSERT